VIYKPSKVLPWSSCLATGTSPQKPGFYSRVVHVEFVMREMALGNVLFQTFRLLNLTVFILVRHTTKRNYRIIVNTVHCDSICRYLLPLHVCVS
jgi:hypothetical protein